MAAYLIADIAKIVDEETYAICRSKVNRGLTEAGGEYLVRGGSVQVIEGDWSPNRLIVVRFPSAEAARRWWNSEEYSNLSKCGRLLQLPNMILVAGLGNEVE